MKKFLLIIALFIGVSSFYNTTEAQNISVNINIGRQPAWGPVGYDYVNYYYFPDIDCYYDVNIGMFYYMNRGRWISARYLPYAYRNYDLYGLYKVVLNVNEPWRYHRNHYRDYARYRGHKNQIVIRDSHDKRYHNSRNNRVTWYSDDNRHSGYNNFNKNDRKYSSGRLENNNRKDYNNNRKDYKNDRKKDSDRKEYNNRKSTSSDRKGSINGRSSAGRSSADNKVTRPSSNNRGDFRMASNTERGTKNR
ncbi:hypothetical protein JGH11_13695 [Dysgonomonas sp. Marseille-P4677]|uniref:hypothetical protein n=1 Tax=Dysgonomonas sp. Marseille-P4677 TaxID=2364790 RepID=UPI001911E510|nr:hypothetical protein [Dysgonomonas sp. Marseille-P4677]MBK5721928.1 hypothetical protein [Dysgonomonas sp. Marseille-P4677]